MTFHSRATALLLRRPVAINWIISIYCIAVCQFSKSLSTKFSASAVVSWGCGEIGCGGYTLFPQNDRTDSPCRKMCRSANCVRTSFDAINDVAGIYCTCLPSQHLRVAHEGEEFKRRTSTMTPRYRFASFKFAHHIRQSRPHSNPLPSSVTEVPALSCHPLSILLIISLNVLDSSVTVSEAISS